MHGRRGVKRVHSVIRERRGSGPARGAGDRGLHAGQRPDVDRTECPARASTAGRTLGTGIAIRSDGDAQGLRGRGLDGPESTPRPTRSARRSSFGKRHVPTRSRSRMTTGSKAKATRVDSGMQTREVWASSTSSATSCGEARRARRAARRPVLRPGVVQLPGRHHRRSASPLRAPASTSFSIDTNHRREAAACA